MRERRGRPGQLSAAAQAAGEFLGEFLGEALVGTADLVWRADCAGCAATGVRFVAPGLCRDCAVRLRRVPERVGEVAWPAVTAAGPYGGVHRAVVLAAKDHHRPDAVGVLGETVAGVVRHLVGAGELPDPRTAPLVLLPAPTRPSAARARGGCVVTRAAEAAARGLGGGACAVSVATLSEGTRDSVGLGRAERAANVSRALRPDDAAVRTVRRLLRTPGAAVCVVDDVCTTGATLTSFALALAARGVVPRVGVVVAHA